MSTFLLPPFNLREGDPIVVQGAAQNNQGWGLYSAPHRSSVAITAEPGQMSDIRVLSQPSAFNPSISLAWEPVATAFDSFASDMIIYELYWDAGTN